MRVIDRHDGQAFLQEGMVYLYGSDGLGLYFRESQSALASEYSLKRIIRDVDAIFPRRVVERGTEQHACYPFLPTFAASAL